MINPNQLGRRQFPASASQWMLVGLRGTTPPAGGLVDGDPVSSWTDSSGNGHTASMTGSNRPTFKTAIVNGKPVVRFTTVGASGLNLVSNISGATAFTCYVVMKTNSSSTELISVASTDGTPYGPSEISGIFYMSNRANYAANSADYSGAFHVIMGACDTGGTFVMRVDGVDKAKVVTALVGIGDFSTIGWRSTGPLYSDGDIAEIVFYNVGVGATDNQNIEKGLGVKYGISVGAGSAVAPDTVSGLVGWWKADSLGVASFDPSTIAGLKLWLKADGITGPPADGTLLTAWNDSSGNAYNLGNGGGTQRPTFKSNIANGKPVLRFDGVANRMFNATSLGLAQPIDIFVVASGNIGAMHTGLLWGVGPTMLLLQTSGNLYMAAPTANQDAVNHSGGFHVFNGLFNAGSSYGLVDGAIVLNAVTTGAGGLNGVYIMADSTNAFFSTGDYAELLIYNSVLSPTDRTNVTNYLKTKYGIP